MLKGNVHETTDVMRKALKGVQSGQSLKLISPSFSVRGDSTFKVEIDTSNAAFEDEASIEVARLLKDIINKLEHGQYKGAVRDINGNKVGSFQLKK